MVVLETESSSTVTSTTNSRMQSYYNSQYVQPLPHEELDSKVSPLAMLTQACNKIESSMLGSSLNKSPKRPRTEDHEERLNSPSTKLPKLASPGVNAVADSSVLPKVSQPLASSEKRKTPERRPSSTSTSVSSNASSPLTSTASLAAARPPMYPPGLIPHMFNPPPMAGGMVGGLRPPHPPTPCNNPYCTDPSCPAGAAFSAFIMGVPPPANMFLPPNLGTPPTSTTTPSAPFVCNWTNSGEVCGRRFSSSEDLMGHLRTHTSTSVAAVSTAPSSIPPTSTTSTLAALQAAQAQALLSPAVTNGASALAALQAQAAKMTVPITTPTTTPSSVDLSAAAAARYHAMTAVRPGLPIGLPPMAPLPPHLASIYGLGSPYSLPMLYPMP